MSKKSIIDDLMNKKMSRNRAIKAKTSDSVSTQDIVLNFLDEINRMGKQFPSIDEYKYAIASQLNILEGRIKTVDHFATVIPGYNEDKALLERITIRWSRHFRKKHQDHERETIYRLDDILLKQLGLL